MLLRSAKNGANGKEATKIVMKPNWMTRSKKKHGTFKAVITDMIVGRCRGTLTERFFHMKILGRLERQFNTKEKNSNYQGTK